MATRAQELRDLIDQASGETFLVREVELELGGRRVPVKLVTPDLLTLQEVVDEVRAGEGGGSDRDFNGRYLLKLIPRIAYADFDVDRMDGELIFPRGDGDPVYRRLTRHATAFAALTLAAAEVVTPLQGLPQAGRSTGAPATAA